MFSSIFGVAAEPVDGEAPAKDEEAAGPSGAAKPALGFDIWGVASAVTKTFQERTNELVKSVQETDWKAELSSFSKTVQDDTKTVAHKTAEFVEHLPEVVEHLPEQAAAVASQAAARLPRGSGAGASQENSLGSALSQFSKTLLVGTQAMITQLRDGVEEEIAAATKATKRSARSSKSATSSASANKLAAAQAKYNRLDAEIASMQRDSSTYLDEPDDEDDFNTWQSTFSHDAVKEDISKLLGSNSFMAELHSRIVPTIIEDNDFWTRYFYRLTKLQQREDQRAQLAQRAQDMSKEEEELGWDDLDPDADSEPGTPAAKADLDAGEVVEPAAAHDVEASSSRAGDEQQGTSAEDPVPAALESSSDTPTKSVSGVSEPQQDSPAPAKTDSSGVAVAASADSASSADSSAKADWCLVAESQGADPTPDLKETAAAAAAAPSAAGHAEVEAGAGLEAEPTKQGEERKRPPKGKEGDEDLDWGNWD